MTEGKFSVLAFSRASESKGVKKMQKAFCVMELVTPGKKIIDSIQIIVS